ncbi:hypothetical protein RMS29_009580 [Agrobacterium rosae]|uniref:Multidrug transporter n=1 Tax=Agrobacterium rosae TaxID=1972867 RepID=A0AAE5RZ35_9HYPH|nr:hypothetical protein [Agrobacterium rosae]KAA3512500.1 hypothetical protein DXM21_12955 [Agrobacterium rosae]KAA3520132.1 hypothetical protein DXM25_10660 [Agrobacterium rosae]MCM2431904.1 hypothetical protein [Agrobacterium rosae]MDX8327861.1 hypothetical protein [Agrobacterium rosae]MQB49049.1 hypothetical protein [Agrobacterium rosae]
MIVGIVLTAILMLFLIAYPKRLKPVVIGLAVIWSGTATWILFDGLRSGERVKAIIATALFDPTCTEANAPIRLSFQNTNNVAVRRLTYTLEGFEAAFRASVSFDPYQISERRIEANETYAACRPFRLRNNETVDPKNLEWRVTIDSAEFD